MISRVFSIFLPDGRHENFLNSSIPSNPSTVDCWSDGCLALTSAQAMANARLHSSWRAAGGGVRRRHLQAPRESAQKKTWRLPQPAGYSTAQTDKMEAAELANLRIQQSYTKERKIGEGTYASVYEGRQKKTDRKVAIKKIKAGQFKDGLDMSAIREVKFLQELSHPNVIGLLDVFSSKSNLNLVLEFLDTDLEAVIKDRDLVFQASDIKSWMLMTMQGLDFCHQNWVLHRDMKPNNLLIASDGTLKIADFGLAREFADPGTRMTCQVVTRWYRPPELLYGARAYSTGVDIWAVGCIFAELMLRTPYLVGQNDFDQLFTIFKALGSPTEQDWPGHTGLADYVEFPKQPKQSLELLFSAAGDDAIDFLQCCLKFDPRKRINSRQALRHKYFNSTPYPTDPKLLPKPQGALVPRPIAPQQEAEGLSTVKKRKANLATTQDLECDERTHKVARRLDFT
ncbi:hypothetical protein O181_021063 [Austropuccinia psidii MF-1]|uniref:[RNA-polymerase]-subunit kinase n=1 Tax=Austropuccinia psidii MF-1 TaxID=1389203 RepID=A0A9Q3CE64_9BASI|nr:hypothetical protein [Austropuccinia psidii MF-1]